MADRHEIFTAADSNYWLQACVLVRSLSLTQRERTHLHVFGCGWKTEMLSSLKRNSFGTVTAEYVEVDESKFEDVKLSHKFPLATAYNVLAADFLLPNVGRATYLDADMVVLEDLEQIRSLELKTPVAAVVDAHVTRLGNPSMWRPWIELGVDPASLYFNTGFMVLDLTTWRQTRLADQVLDLLRQYQMPCVDQDALNLILRGNFDRLSPRFNSMPYHLLQMFRNADVDETPNAIADAISDPAVLHFHRSFLGKPWLIGCTHPGRSLWRQLANEVSKDWRKSAATKDFVRNRAARLAGMAKVDPRAESMAHLRLKEARSGSYE